MKLRSLFSAYPRIFMMLIVVLAMLGFAGNASFYWLKVKNEEQAALAALEEHRATVVIASNQAALASLIRPYEARLTRLSAKLNRQFSEGEWLAAIQSMADATGTRLGNFRMDDRKSVGGYEVRSAYVELAGEYEATRRFINRLDELPFAAVAGNAILERDPKSIGKVRTTLELITFVRDGGMPK